MKRSTRAAAALAVGYMLGRQRKLRTAAVMAAATAVGGTTVGGLVMRRGMKMLGSTDALGKIAPQLTEITETLRGDLLTAGKAAVSAAAANQLDALTDSIHERAERVRNPGAAVAEGATDAAEGTARTAGGTARKAGRTVSAAGGTVSSAGGTARRAAGRRGSQARGDDATPDDEYEDYEPEEPDDDQQDYGDQDDDDNANAERDEEPADADSGDEPEAPRRASRGSRAGTAGKTAAGPATTGGRPATRRSPVTRTGR